MGDTALKLSSLSAYWILGNAIPVSTDFQPLFDFILFSSFSKNMLGVQWFEIPFFLNQLPLYGGICWFKSHLNSAT